MSDGQIPAEAPPPYTKNPQNTLSSPTSHGISASARRSMEDELRALPEGWVRQYDATNNHQFFVDSKANPPRSIWHHPYDDDKYLSTLSSEERERLQDTLAKQRPAKVAAPDDSDDELDTAGPSSRPNDAYANPEVRRASTSGKPSFGRKMKDKLTGTTHEQREAQRRIRDAQEAEAYAAHQKMRKAMARAAQTGQPVYVAKDRQGNDIYVEPPAFGNRYYAGRPGNYRGIDPYSQGPYGNPNARFMSPPGPYSGRPYNRGYGGGMGLPLAGGLMGGLLLGGMLGGF